jgi:Tol biopolymer transport system component
MRSQLLLLSLLVCAWVSAQPMERFAFTTQAGVAKRVALFEDGNISFLSPPDLMAESPMIRPGTQDVFYLVTTGSNERAIYSTNAKSGDTKSWSPEGAMEGGVEFSPDGNYLYFVSTRSGSPGVFRRDLRSENVETIADGPWPEFDPRLSVDGRELLYVEWTDDGYYLHSWNTENGSQRQVLHDSLLISNVRWSKNDYSFVYIRNEAPYWEIREYFPLRDSTFSVRWGVPTMADPMFSSNGEQIFYSMEHDGQWDIFAYRRSSDKHRGIIAGKKDDLKPRFHPSGDWIWYNEKTKDGWRVMKKVIRGKSPRPMINGKEFSCYDAVWFPPED